MRVWGQPRLTRYAVVFSVEQRKPAAGALLVEADGLRLEGGTAADRVELRIPYAEVAHVRVGRSLQERLNGHPTLLVEREGKPTVRINALGAGILSEITDLLAVLAAAPTARRERVAVIVPLRKGCLAQAEELIAHGPPFDPAALGLTQHQVFLSTREAIFIFVGLHAQATLDRATRDPTLWHVALAWRGCIAGRPRLCTKPETQPANARLVYSWSLTTSAH